MNKKDNGSNKYPGWMNPANDRKTPYTEEEIDTFVEDFILGLDEQEWLSITAEHGEEKARAYLYHIDQKKAFDGTFSSYLYHIDQ